MRNSYVNPLCVRYASGEMKFIFSDDNKFSTWRKLWTSLAESEMELGIPNISQEQIDEMKAHIFDIDYDRAREYESKLRHDVMAHVHTFGDACPKARPIIHLGATSCYVGDNTDIIVLREAMLQIKKLLVNAIKAVSDFAERWKDEPTLAYTHFQAAQPTTIGKRATLWCQDLIIDLENLDFQLSSLKFFGCKGTTGTGASFLELFEGDKKKVAELEMRIARKMGFDKCMSVSGQTYTRKVDYNVLSVLSGIAQSVTKFSTDIRLLSHLKEFDEPFEAGQIGSSAMAYKRNPMRSERMASLARYIIADTMNPAITAATQWFERTLDDSANRRISLPEAFLAADSILSLLINVISGGSVYPVMAKRHLDEELPFIATENILMDCARRGADRQDMHEAIREYSVAVAKCMKLEGKDNDLLDRLLADKRFMLTKEDLDRILNVRSFIGLAPEQTESFIENEVKPVLEKNKDLLGVDVRITV